MRLTINDFDNLYSGYLDALLMFTVQFEWEATWVCELKQTHVDVKIR